MLIKFRKIVRLYPYEQVHAQSSPLVIEDKDGQWYKDISKALESRTVLYYDNCEPGWFSLSMDNKITLELEGGIYVTYWDNNVYISTSIRPFNSHPKSVVLE